MSLLQSETMLTGTVAPVSDMTRTEAMAAIGIIRSEYQKVERALSIIRLQLYNLTLRKGWKALGYKTQTEGLKAIFGRSAAQIDRLIAANNVEMQVNQTIGEIPERVLRPLTKRGYTEEARRMLYQIAVDVTGEEPTSGVMQEVVDALGEAIATATLQASENQHPIAQITTDDETNEKRVIVPLYQMVELDIAQRIQELKERRKNHKIPANRTYLVSSAGSNAHIKDNILTVRLDNPIEVQAAISMLKVYSGKPVHVNVWTVIDENPIVDKTTGEIIQ